MAVPCPGCGREYDVTLFEFGRTLHCTCGRRVGLEARVQPADDPLLGGELRFMVDAMLGGLARWLRMIGYDAAYEAHIEDGDLVRRAVAEKRIVLTRDRGLLAEWRVPRALLVEEDEPLQQLRQVVVTYRLDWRSRLFSRCSVCGSRLEGAPPEDVERVPAAVRAEQRVFRACRPCGKIYWSGSHTDRMRETLAEALGNIDA